MSYIKDYAIDLENELKELKENKEVMLKKAYELWKLVQQIESLWKYHDDWKDHWIEYSMIDDKKRIELESKIGDVVCWDWTEPIAELEDLIPYPIQWI